MTEPREPQRLPIVDAPQVVHVADESDLSLERVAKLAADKGVPLRMRISIQLWDFENYVAWKGQVWRVEVRDKDEAAQTQKAMEEFFDLVSLAGSDQAGEKIAALVTDLRTAALNREGQETPHAGSTEQS